MSQERARVVVVGGGFGGLTAARALARAPVDVTLVDRSNHHLFQPLLYQVAMAGLSATEIAMPIRSILSRQKNAVVLLADVRGVDLARKRVVLDDGELPYDYVVVAAGAATSYFGHDAWEAEAPGLKSLEDALEIRRRVLSAFELAERSDDADVRRRLLTFVVIGGGPTGVELAGALRELAKFVLARDFRRIQPGEARVVLVEAGAEVLATFGPELAAKARASLVDLGVEVRTGVRVTGIDANGVALDGARLDAATVVWAAGVRASPLAASLGVPLDRQGRVVVAPDVSIPGHPEAFVVGDMARFEQGGAPLPGVSPVAMQQARHVAKIIAAAAATPGTAAARPTFRYVDKGTMATIGRSRAIAAIGRVHLSGFIAWLAWLAVHIVFLIGFRNRVVVLVEWAWSYVTYKRGARIITGVTSRTSRSCSAPSATS